MSAELSPEQAVAMLEQAESLVENGEFDPDTFTPDFGATDGVAGETGADNSTETPPTTTPDNPQDTPQTPSEQPPKELDYVQLLAQERAERLALEQRLAQLQAPQAQEQTPPQDEQAVEIDPDELFGEFDGKGLMNGINHILSQRLEKMVEQQLSQRLSVIEQKHQQDLYAEHIKAINSAIQDNAETVVESAEFQNWVNSQPSYVSESINYILNNGSTKQVIEVLTNYKATLTPPPATPKTDDVQAKADDIIKNTTPSVPNSLSEMGGQTVTDPMQAVANMSPAQMAEAMEDWTQEQIDTFMNRYF